MDESSRLAYLLSDLCTDFGFCDAGRDPDRFKAMVPLGVDAFTDAVLLAEGLDPATEKHRRRQVRDYVAKRFAAWNAGSAA